MGFFSSTPPHPKPAKKPEGITPKEYVHDRLYAKFRAVFPYGPRGVKKERAFNSALDIKEDEHGHPPHLTHTIQEDTLEQKLRRLEDNRLITPQEAAKIREVADEDLHN